MLNAPDGDGMTTVIDKSRGWLVATVQLVLSIGAVVPAIGFFVLSVTYALVAPALPRSTLLEAESIRTLTVEGARWLIVTLGMAAFPVAVGLGLVNIRRRTQPLSAQIRSILDEIKATRAEVTTRSDEITELHGAAADGTLESEEAKAAQELSTWHEHVLTKLKDLEASARSEFNQVAKLRELGPRQYLLALLVGSIPYALFTPWASFLVAVIFGLSSLSYLHYLSRQVESFHALHFLPIIFVAAIAAVLFAVPASMIGAPAEHEFKSAAVDGIYARISRDGEYSYLWPCGQGVEKGLVAVPTGEISSIRFLPSASRIRATLVDVIRGSSESIRPRIDCGG